LWFTTTAFSGLSILFVSLLALSKTMSMRGPFILLEGVDRCGKTTQCKLLTSRFANAVPMNFPDRSTAIGKTINSYLTNSTEMDDHAIHLLFSANRWEAVPFLTKQLREGKPVICDRYGFSGVAFTAAKEINGMGIEWCKRCDVGQPKPDAVIFLTLSGDDAESRGGFGDERYEKTEFQEKVRAVFKKLQDGENSHVVKDGEEIDAGANWFEVDAKGSIEEVQERINKVVDIVCKRVENGGKLGRMFEDGEYQL